MSKIHWIDAEKIARIGPREPCYPVYPNRIETKPSYSIKVETMTKLIIRVVFNARLIGSKKLETKTETIETRWIDYDCSARRRAILTKLGLKYQDILIKNYFVIGEKVIS